MQEASEKDSPGLTLMDHLGELRERLIRAAYAILGGTALCWAYHDWIMQVATAPIRSYLPGGHLAFTNPVDAFMTGVKLSVGGGVVLASPVWIYQLWKFIAPGLYSHEKKYTSMFVGAGVSLFLLGASFVYFLVLPMAFKFLLTFAGDVATPMITLSEYLSFFLTTTLVLGGAFELKLVLTMLGILGLVSPQFLREKRRYAIVILAVISAIITPPDMLSMLMLLVPMVLLYEISIVLVAIVAKKKEAKIATGQG